MTAKNTKIRSSQQNQSKPEQRAQRSGRVAMLGAAIAAVGLFMTAGPAAARNDFANGFEDEAGRILAQTIFGIGRVAIAAHHDRHEVVREVHYRPQRSHARHHRRAHKIARRHHRAARHDARHHDARVYSTTHHYHHGSKKRCSVDHRDYDRRDRRDRRDYDRHDRYDRRDDRDRYDRRDYKKDRRSGRY